jgi:hypothetical protein
MKNVLGVVYKRLTDTASVTALVGTRIYPTTVPQQATPPFIRTSLVGTLPIDTKNAPADVDQHRVQIDCIATTYTQALNIAQAVRTSLDRYRGSVTLQSGNVFVDGVRYLMEVANMEFEKDLHAHIIDFQIRLHQ